MRDAREADLLSARDSIHTIILESLPAGVAVLAGPDLVCEYANRALEELSPWRTVLHRPLAEAYPEAARLHPVARRVLETGEPVHVEDLPFELARRPEGPVELRYFTATLRRVARVGQAPAVVATVLETTGRVRSLAQADLLSSVAAELASCDELDAALRIAVSGGAVLVGAEDGCVALLSPGGDRLTFAFEMRRQGRVGAGDDLVDMPCARSAMDRGRAAFLPRAGAVGAEARWMDLIGIGGAIVAPLVHERRRVGVLFLDLPAGRTPDRADLALAEAIAAHCTLAVDRARAFEAERDARARAEKAEERSLRAVTAQQRIAELAARLSSAARPAAVADVVFSAAVDALSARWASIGWLADGALEFPHGCGVPAAMAAHLRRISLDAPLPSAEAVRSRTALWLSTEAIAVRYPRLVEMWAGVGDPVGSLVAAPLVVEGRCLGALSLSFASPEPPSDPGDRAFVQALTHHCAQALDRARLLDEADAARERAVLAKREALQAADIEQRIAAIVGHDLRTPLAVISLTAHGLAAVGGLTERQGSLVARIQSSARRMDGIIRDLLDATRARNGMGIRICPASARLDDICAHAVGELQHAHASTRIELSSCGDTSGQWDGPRLEQVVSNLVANAVRHAAPGTPVRVSARGEEQEVVLEVANAGDPIPPHVLSSIFDPFSSGDAKGNGLGLGLFIVREIVSAHGGTVGVRSRDDEGTVFSVRLPRHA